MFARYTASLGTASLITLGLLFLMQQMIASGKAVLTERKVGPWTPFVVEQTDPPVLETRRERPRRNTIEDPPSVQISATGPAGNGGITLRRPGPVDFVGPSHRGRARPADGDLLPIVKVQPAYPRSAILRELEGWVLVEFTVTESGSVVDAVAVESSDAVFERAAVEAALRFRYRPRVVNGEPVRVSSVRNLIRFELDSGHR